MPFKKVPWWKGKNRAEIIEKMSRAKMGKKLSLETREKIARAHMGKKQSPETIEKRASKLRGRVITKEWREKISKANKGKTLSAETRENIRLAGIGRKVSKETREKLRQAQLRRIELGIHNRWRGDDVGYSGLHQWVRRVLGIPDQCEHCGTGNLQNHKIHWANKSGEYKREEDDWIRLCGSCHKKYDRDYEQRERDERGRFV